MLVGQLCRGSAQANGCQAVCVQFELLECCGNEVNFRRSVKGRGVKDGSLMQFMWEFMQTALRGLSAQHTWNWHMDSAEPTQRLLVCGECSAASVCGCK